MKTCSKCNLSKDLSEFYSRGPNRKDSQSYCKPCLHSVQMKRWKAVKVKAIEYKGNCCSDCKVKFDRPEVYQFHHLNPGEKDVDWGKLRLRCWEKIIKELDKCVLLCANCHIIRHSKPIEDY